VSSKGPWAHLGIVHKTKPLLFLSILSVASGMSHHEMQSSLTKRVMRIYADPALCSGKKTLELVEAMQVSATWYWPHERFEELKFYELIHLMAIIAIDMGLGRRKDSAMPGRINPGPWRGHPGQRSLFPPTLNHWSQEGSGWTAIFSAAS
jgi:hypothetical protein